MKRFLKWTAVGLFYFTFLCCAMVVGAGLSGCASAQQAVQAYGTVAVTGAQAANDTIIEAQKIAFCGLPLSAIARHPEIIPAVRSLCLSSNDKNGATLLDAIEAPAK